MSSQIQKGENYILENADLVIEEYYSVDQKKFYLGTYERYKWEKERYNTLSSLVIPSKMNMVGYTVPMVIGYYQHPLADVRPIESRKVRKS